MAFKSFIFVGSLFFAFTSGCTYNKSKITCDTNALNTATLRNEAAVTVYQSRCTACHFTGNSDGREPLDYTTDEDFIDSDLIVEGEPENSEAFYRIIGAGEIPNEEDMPDGFEITSDEICIIRHWIENLEED